MKDQFDIWRYHFPDKGEHSVVLLSHPDICATGTMINVLYCTSQRQNRAPRAYEVILNSADGFEWETFCNCSVIYLVPAAALFGRRGCVSHPRRLAIRSKVRDLFRLAATD